MRSQTCIENDNDTDSANNHPAVGTVSAPFAFTLLGNIQGVPLFIRMATSFV